MWMMGTPGSLIPIGLVAAMIAVSLMLLAGRCRAIGLVPVRPGGRFGRGTAFGDPKSHDGGGFRRNVGRRRCASRCWRR
jgi:hypothetical protein